MYMHIISLRNVYAQACYVISDLKGVCHEPIAVSEARKQSLTDMASILIMATALQSLVLSTSYFSMSCSPTNGVQMRL